MTPQPPAETYRVVVVTEYTATMSRVGRLLERARIHVERLVYGSDPRRAADPRFNVVLFDSLKMDAEHLWRQQIQDACPDAAVIGLVMTDADADKGRASGVPVHGWVNLSGQHPTQFREEIKSAMSRRLREDLLQRDALTGLPNRTVFIERLRRAIRRAERNETTCAVVAFDLNGLKSINDRSGHAVGDAVLQGVSNHVSQVVRETDTFARVGGDEFLVLAEDVDTDGGLRALVRRIHRACCKKISVDGHPYHPSAAFGIALYGRDGKTPEALMRWADEKMMDQKASGVPFVPPRRGSGSSEQVWRLDHLRRLLEADELRVRDQLRIGVDSRIPVATSHRIVVASGSIHFDVHKALIRGDDNDDKEVLWRWLLEQAAQRVRRGVRRVVVDAPSKHFGEVRWLAPLLSLKQAGVDQLEVSVPLDAGLLTEHELICGIEACADVGVEVALAGYGQDLACVGWARGSGARRLVLGEELISGIDKRGHAKTATCIAIEAAASSGLKTVASGVRCDNQLDLLSEWGCDEAQGMWCDVVAKDAVVDGATPGVRAMKRGA